MFNTFYYMLGPFCHWIYASQYLKTCFLTSGIVNKALLLLARHKTVIENEYNRTSLMSDFIRNNDAIDTDIKNERNRSKRIHKTFFMIDLVSAVLVFSV